MNELFFISNDFGTFFALSYIDADENSSGRIWIINEVG